MIVFQEHLVIIKSFKEHGYTFIYVFQPFLQRGKTFVTPCLLSWTMQSFQKKAFSSRKEFAPMGANSFLEEITPNEMRGKHENKRVASPGSVHFHLKINSA